ncbi:MAG: DUF4097 family beta strand repeat protein [Flavobacteriaceae bacterium]
MKRILFFIGLLLTFSNLTAQKKVTETKSASGINEVFVHAKFANNIVIKNWNKNEISVQAEVNIDDNKHNDYFTLKADKIGTTYTIKSDYGDYFKKYRSYNSYSSRSKSKDKKDDDDDCNCNEHSNIVNYVIYVPKSMDLKVKSISGSVATDTFNGFLELDLISGDIDIKKHSKKMMLKTISGDIDLYISDATFEAKTLTGGVYSDLDIDFSNNNRRSHGHTKIRATIKNGNANLKMSTISGDIFLRKS